MEGIMPVSTTRAPARRTRGRLDDGAPNPVDVHVGARMKLRRTLLGMSQEKLGEAIGLTFQQVQKYERGANRVGASRLFDLARVLDVPVSFFFDDLPDASAASSPVAVIKGEAARVAGAAESETLGRDLLELSRHYRALSPAQRAAVRNIVRSMAVATTAEGQGG